MSNSKLAALKAAFEKKNTGSGTGDQTWKLKYPFWKMEDGAVATVRFLPDLNESNDLGFLVENLTHELVVNGKKHTVACASMHGERCPICDLARKYYDEEGDGSLNGKKYYRKKQYLGQVIVVESTIEHDANQFVKLIEFGPAVFKQIQAAFQSGDLEEAPYEFKGGYNFRIKKTQDGKYSSYSTSSFAPKQSDLDDELLDKITLFDLSEYRGTKLDVATVEVMLLADQTGAAFNSGNEQTPAPTPTTSAPAPTPAQESTPAATVQESAPTPSSDNASKSESVYSPEIYCSISSSSKSIAFNAAFRISSSSVFGGACT
jgi:hypothetical protein